VLRHALGDHWLHQWQGRLWLGPRGPAPSDAAAPDAPACGAWDGRTPLALPDGGSIRLLGAPRLDAPLRAVPRARAPAKLEAPPGRAARSLQSVFASLGVPPWRRGAVPLLVDDTGRLAAVGDLAYAPGLDAWLRACGARLRWTPGPG
jgi:tRNA(Ile)-lysidine synthase